MAAGPPIRSPFANTNEYDGVQVQVPIFFNRQVFTKAVDGAYVVPSGTLTSAINEIQSQRVMGVEVAGMEVGIGVTTGNTKLVEVGARVEVGWVPGWVAVGWVPGWLAAWVSSASIVWAAAVTMGLKVATASGVPDGPQAVTSIRMVVKSSGI
jgi:hypothetical protein